MRAAARVAERMLRRTGVVGGSYRIKNIDRDCVVLGYTEINQLATTPFSRTKTHKAWFAGDAAIANGELIQDRVDGNYYLVMSLKPEYAGGRVAFYDGTLYYANSVIELQRFSAEGKDSYGRSTATGPAVIATGVRAMVTPLSFTDNQQEDQILDVSKLRVAVQSTVPVQSNDRIVTDAGEVFRVASIDRTSLDGLYLLGVEPDIR